MHQGCQTDHEDGAQDDNQLTRQSDDPPLDLAQPAGSLHDLKNKLNEVCNKGGGKSDKSDKIEKVDETNSSKPPLTNQKPLPKSGTSSLGDDEMDGNAYPNMDSTKMLTELCGEMKNCLREFVSIMQELLQNTDAVF